jgi:hypothetical protein
MIDVEYVIKLSSEINTLDATAKAKRQELEQLFVTGKHEPALESKQYQKENPQPMVIDQRFKMSNRPYRMRHNTKVIEHLWTGSCLVTASRRGGFGTTQRAIIHGRPSCVVWLTYEEKLEASLINKRIKGGE